MSLVNGILTFMVVAFAYALIIIMKRESLPERLRRPLALIGIVLVLIAFVLMMISFFLPG
jgi:hypothetical protein